MVVNASPAAKVIQETNFPGIAPLARGKVRDIYDLGDRLLIVATDRLSAFDVVMPTPIPDKGRVLTQLSLFWFDLLKDILPNHVLSATEFPAPFDQFQGELAGRSMVVKKTTPLPIECVARGYLSGSGWKEYQATGTVCGIALPSGLRESDKLPEVIFTPATKSATGHDANIPFARAAEMLGKETPDSSRFWPAAEYKPGGPQPSFDKQFVRDYLERIRWPKTPPGPSLSPDVVAATRAKYREAYRILVGRELDS